MSPVSDSVQTIDEVSRNMEERVAAMQRLTNAVYDGWLARVNAT